ncbi:Transcriptional adapter ADA2 [Capsicum chinense]|nr:Transcriptional adapter ADA2 [Capsicum chinense]
MGRSRRNFQADEDPSQRSRRKKNASSGDNLESVIPVYVDIMLLNVDYSDQGTTDGKKALYHCNYCNKDISGRTRIKCAVCSDFDLCIECFSVGAEVHPHKSYHHYRVMLTCQKKTSALQHGLDVFINIRSFGGKPGKVAAI